MNNSIGFDAEKQGKLIFLVAIFFTALFVSNVISAKLFTIGGVVLTAGIITYPLTFLITDSISEVYGKVIARKVVLIGLLTNVLMIGFFYLAIMLPPAGYWPMQEEFEMILGAVPRIVIASLLAYSISQLFDVHLFHKLKEKTKGKHLWLRNNVSTLASQMLDSIVFVVVAFYGTMPFSTILVMIGTQYIVKLLFAIADTPFIYLTVKWLNKSSLTNKKEAVSHVS
ncbi:queuosine precursor transporter [Bacillus shivajii]|uniref:queuosine precursor transporter n=1 Tax=Bacillus shivajii TaxID=1983719 RepID=UPI001CFA6212|nr:queuosine precursor transporter [Bacillus shivajii]UCZ53132.1 queuosine precursor transporter [Bacillus shivajii]